MVEKYVLSKFKKNFDKIYRSDEQNLEKFNKKSQYIKTRLVFFNYFPKIFLLNTNRLLRDKFLRFTKLSVLKRCLKNFK